MSWHRLRRAVARYGLKGMVLRAPARLGAITHAMLTRLFDTSLGTYADATLGNPRAFLPDDLNWTDPSQRETVTSLAGLYHAHRFDLLGSGWLSVGYHTESPGFEGHQYHMPPELERGWPMGARWPAATRREAARIRALIPSEYEPIDWHRDHKSGFRWPPSLHVTQNATAPAPGADVKMPWELARMQHLPILAHAYALDLEGDTSRAEYHLREIESQILDFISSNPPKLGVNWQCTMDVGIRVATWVLTVELLRARGAQFRDGFMTVLVRSVYEHASHIVRHLEFSPSYRDNHYLANIAGLVFSATFLPAGSESDAWLAFGMQELAAEVAQQFHEDGSGFEGSIPYHALSLDVALWSAWLVEILGPGHRGSLSRHADVASALPRSRSLRACGIDPSASPRLPAATWQRLGCALQFLSDVTRPDGTLPQVGDDDSGRFFRVTPKIHALTPTQARLIYAQLSDEGVRAVGTYLDEQLLDRGPLVAFGSAIVKRSSRIRPSLGESPEARLGGLIEIPGRPSLVSGARTIGSLAEWERRLRGEFGVPVEIRFDLNVASGPPQDIEFDAYAGMGIYVWRSTQLFLLVRCGEVGQRGRGGHAHNDQLGIELISSGVERVVDPGTFVYTASAKYRNHFRSARAHFVPALPDGEQNVWPDDAADLFRLIDAQPGQRLYAGPDGFAGRFAARGCSVARIVRRSDDAIVVFDFAAGRAANPEPRTLGYGRRVRSGVGHFNV